MFPRHPRVLPALIPGLLSVLLAAVLPSAGAAAPGSCGRPSGCNSYELIHAGSTYAWWTSKVIRHEFETTGEQLSGEDNPVPGPFSYTGTPDNWAKKYGTLQIEQSTGDLVADWNQPRRYGRWEVRFRSKTGTTSRRVPDGLPAYQVKLELVPTGAAQRCAPASVVMASYDQNGSGTATVGLHRPGLHRAATVTPAGPLYDVDTWNGTQDVHVGAWRVWAVEVTRTSVSWFLDGRIVNRLPITNAMRGQRLHLRLSLLATPGAAQMDPTVVQADWFRYYPLGRTTKKKRLVRQLKRAPQPARVAGNPSVGC